MYPFFYYFGSKHKLAKNYGPPRRDIVVEPFAGGAGYSLYWNVKKAILIEKDPCTYGIWNWLINHAEYEDMISLDPNLTSTTDCDYPQHIKDFIGFWFGRGNSSPRPNIARNNLKKKQAKDKTLWGYDVINRLANQLHRIKDWEIIHGDYTDSPDIDAHWHIDPPYQYQGTHYKCGSNGIDFEKLGEWCLSRKGSGEVCEASPADWLPFEPLKTRKNQRNDDYTEIIYRLGINKSNLFE